MGTLVFDTTSHAVDCGLLDKLTPVCEDPGLCLRQGCPQGNVMAPFLSLLRKCRLLLQPNQPSAEVDDSAIVGLIKNEVHTECWKLTQHFVDSQLHK